MIALRSLQSTLKGFLVRLGASNATGFPTVEQNEPNTIDPNTEADMPSVSTISVSSALAKVWTRYRASLLSITVIILGSFFYGRALLNFDPNMILTGKEVEWTLEADIVAWQSILQFGELPLWNPYWNTGRPLLADPFFHGLDPKFLLPQALFGVMNGAKTGLVLSFAVMGVGGWWLGRVMGLGQLARTWLGIMLAFNGHIIGYFSGVGSIGLGLSYVYVVWVIATTLTLRKEPSPRHAVLFAISIALLFFGSNFYFFAYTALAMGFILICEGLNIIVRKKEWADYRTFLIRATQGSILAFTLSAVLLLPQIEVIPYLNKPPIDDNTPAGQPIEALFLNFAISDIAYYQTDLFNLYGHMIGHYSYIGLLPFLFLLGIPLAWQPDKKRSVLWLIAILFFGITYAAGTHTPLWAIYRNIPGAETLRFPERTLGIAVIVILALAAIGLDKGWQASKQNIYRVAIARGEDESEPLIIYPINIVQCIGVILAITAIWMVYQGNSQHFTLSQRLTANDSAVVSAQNSIGERDYHLFVPVDFSLVATSRMSAGQINAPLTWVLDRPAPQQAWLDVMHRGAEYALTYDNMLPPEQMGRHEQIANFVGYDLYYLPDAMPYAYTTEWDTTPAQALLEAPDHVSAITATRPTLRRIHVRANTVANERLVVAESFYPGWQAFIDGKSVPLENFDGFLSTRTIEGDHEYSFYFDPWIPKVGIFITIVSLPYAIWVYGKNKWLPWKRQP